MEASLSIYSLMQNLAIQINNLLDSLANSHTFTITGIGGQTLLTFDIGEIAVYLIGFVFCVGIYLIVLLFLQNGLIRIARSNKR